MTTFYADEGGRLASAQPKETGHDQHVVDPTVGLHLLPWDPQAPVTPMPHDRAADDHRCLTYDTAPLGEDLEIVGSPEAVICLSADEPEFPLHVALCDVAPDGHSTLICQGWGSASILAGEPLQSGRIYDLRVPLYATSSRVTRGHQLRLVVSGADFPLLWPAPRNPRLDVVRGSGRGTRVRIPIALLTSQQTSMPTLRQLDRAKQTNTVHGHSRILSDLAGETASFDQRSEQRHELADGTILRIVEQTVSTVPRSHPGRHRPHGAAGGAPRALK
jgi:putative CocE/NonD family hydrolase